MQELVFDTAHVALLDTVTPPRQPRMHVLSALPGTGKSTFSNALAAAIVACGGSVLFVVEQMEAADQRYRDLNEILPGHVAVWPTDPPTRRVEPWRAVVCSRAVRETTPPSADRAAPRIRP